MSETHLSGLYRWENNFSVRLLDFKGCAMHGTYTLTTKNCCTILTIQPEARLPNEDILVEMVDREKQNLFPNISYHTINKFDPLPFSAVMDNYCNSSNGCKFVPIISVEYDVKYYVLTENIGQHLKWVCTKESAKYFW